MTQSNRMPARHPVLPLVAFVVLTVGQAWPQAAREDFRVYTESPRLFLQARRLRLLRRERERQSIRWQQFETLMAGKALMPEPGFSLALYWQTTGDPLYSTAAIEWALGPEKDVRQIAIVYDWCRQRLTEGQTRTLEGKLRSTLERPDPPPGVPAMRDRVVAAIALADREPQLSERVLRQSVQQWWRGVVVPALKRGESAVKREDMYALFEILHAVRDNLNIDLREQIHGFFKDLPQSQVLGYYPAPYQAPENEYRIPASRGVGEPDLKRAALSRAAELAMVAYDPNNQEIQFLQGWLIHDQFLLRGAFGIPYEFLWANPYLPGVSYYHLPLAYQDPIFGRLFLRSSWEDDAQWLGCFDGAVQVFDNGAPKVLNSRTASKPVLIGDALVFFDRPPHRYRIDNADVNVVFLVGLLPHRKYEVEVDDEEMEEQTADAGGILTVKVTPQPDASLRIRQAPEKR